MFIRLRKIGKSCNHVAGFMQLRRKWVSEIWSNEDVRVIWEYRYSVFSLLKLVEEGTRFYATIVLHNCKGSHEEDMVRESV